MNFENYIARHLIKGERSGFARPIVKIAVFSITLGLVVMIVSVSVLIGFQSEIRDKVIGFGGHIQIKKYETTTNYEVTPLIKDSVIGAFQGIEGISHIQVFAAKAGIIKKEVDFEGIIFKGISNDFDWSFFEEKLIKGRTVQLNDSTSSKDVMVSKYMADRLKIDTNDRVIVYFIVDNKLRPRPLNVCGIYHTGLEELDKQFVVGDIGHIQKLNKWKPNEAGGIEVFIDDFKQIKKKGEEVYNKLPYDLKSETIKDMYPQIFDWLKVLDKNVIVILVLMIVVSIINMISTLLIIIIEKTNTIGILKSLGTKNKSIQQIFVYQAGYIIGKGLLWGNIIGLLICFVQWQFGIIKLDASSYYVSQVPIEFNFLYLLTLNIGTMLICLLMMIVPSFLITRITPVKAMRFD